MSFELDNVKRWFDGEVAKLTDRMMGGYPKDQFDLDLEMLRSQRDIKMKALDDESVEAAHEGEVPGGVKAGMHADDASKYVDGMVVDGSGGKSKRKRQPKKTYPTMPGGAALYMQSCMPALHNPQLLEVMSKPSVVTWWQAKGPAQPEMPHQFKPKKKHRVDHRVALPGIGSRGADKRVPRQLSFKMEVINHYMENQRLKGEGRLDDPCLATARHFGIHKSQVSKWASKRQQIQDKLARQTETTKKGRGAREGVHAVAASLLSRVRLSEAGAGQGLCDVLNRLGVCGGVLG
eukprot:CAMPEP_0206231842 /NCGR_PEP_ID=MMETSP0047_2-20121206/11068_1 /ASSEMBLY_ACC=CAM_ASM_000192 /TAXON_ID=195065 /ORGANISM="Chroomonas mesostigmatica_cf, Strain CCMP1168" /LENGTH=290 /DNA_ID=CAMNT_0053655479 /DNA_START=11 /DNA_END=881 /DNA_ORIENTATION=+